ncbi:MAG: hypothetical protein HBSAPP03_09920 [Phycisphaerae bacterium]|nr:MAG: hypothetical protein HBSAPP03_09920 [Phycisphaerae bacterium]
MAWWMLGCAGLGVALAWTMKDRERAFLAEARAMSTTQAPPRPLAEIASALRAAKLVTVEIDTTVALSRGDMSWRGDAAARLEVPVRLHYGVDLAAMQADAVGFSPITPGVCIVRVPAPARVATEVFLEQERAEVEVGWLRLRSRAGEYYLGLARRDAADAARALVLAPDDAAKVREVSREQIADVVRRLLGDGTIVHVRFEDAP